MKHKTGNASIPLDGSAMDGYLAVPPGDCRGSILLIQEIFGVTPAMRAIADDHAAAGFTVLVPDIYWRLERKLDLGNGEDEAQRNLAVSYANRYDEQLGTQDLLAAVEWLAATSQGPRPAVMGFCLGGRMAVRVATEASLSCMVSMYGVGLNKMGSEIAASRCPLQFHFGENDNHNPPNVIEDVRNLVAQRQRKEDEFFTYPAAEHAFYNRFRLDRFNQAAHDLAKARVLSFLGQHATLEA